MPSRPAKENRKSPRVEISRGVWVSWHASGPRNISRNISRDVSRVRDLSAGGVFIHTDKAVAVGTAVKLLFAMPEGEIRTDGVVRYADAKKGIGVEFTRMGAADRARLLELLRRLNR